MARRALCPTHRHGEIERGCIPFGTGTVPPQRSNGTTQLWSKDTGLLQIIPDTPPRPSSPLKKFASGVRDLPLACPPLPGSSEMPGSGRLLPASFGSGAWWACRDHANGHPRHQPPTQDQGCSFCSGRLYRVTASGSKSGSIDHPYDDEVEQLKRAPSAQNVVVTLLLQLGALGDGEANC